MSDDDNTLRTCGHVYHIHARREGYDFRIKIDGDDLRVSGPRSINVLVGDVWTLVVVDCPLVSVMDESGRLIFV